MNGITCPRPILNVESVILRRVKRNKRSIHKIHDTQFIRTTTRLRAVNIGSTMRTVPTRNVLVARTPIMRRPRFLTASAKIRLASFLRRLRSGLLAHRAARGRAIVILMVQLPQCPGRFASAIRQVSKAIFYVGLTCYLKPTFFHVRVLGVSSTASVVLLCGSTHVYSIFETFYGQTAST